MDANVDELDGASTRRTRVAIEQRVVAREETWRTRMAPSRGQALHFHPATPDAICRVPAWLGPQAGA